MALCCRNLGALRQVIDTVATLFMFKPEARLNASRETIVLKLTNTRILGIEHSGDELIVHVDRDAGEILRLAA